MKCVILFALFAFARAGYLQAPAAVAVAAPAVLANTGTSVQSRTQDNLGNYAFGYDEAHGTGGTFRRESGNALGIVKGSYGLRDIDGRARVVNYIADAAGFRANIQTNEPGVDPSRDPAATLINKQPVAVAAAPIVAAPAIAAPAVSYGGLGLNHGIAYGGHGLGLNHGLAYGGHGLGLNHGIAYGAGHLGLASGLGHGIGYGGVLGHQKVLL